MDIQFQNYLDAVKQVEEDILGPENNLDENGQKTVALILEGFIKPMMQDLSVAYSLLQQPQTKDEWLGK